LPSADNDKFTLNGSELTFKATDFKAQNNTYRVNVDSKPNRYNRVFILKKSISRGNMKFPIMYGYSEGFYKVVGQNLLLLVVKRIDSHFIVTDLVATYFSLKAVTLKPKPSTRWKLLPLEKTWA
jgi:hypothetical protein